MADLIVQTSIHNTHEMYNKKLIANCAYVRVHEAPHNAHIVIRIGSTVATPLKVSKGDFFRLSTIEPVYFSADKVDDTDIVFITSNDKDFELETAPIMKLEDDVEQALKNQNVNSFSSALLAELDKITNPYEYIGEVKGIYTDGTEIDIINTTLNDCDKIVVTLIGDYGSSSHISFFGWFLSLYLDNILSLKSMSQAGAGTKTIAPQTTFYNVRGQNLILKGMTDNNGRELHYSIKKYRLKA